MLRDSDHQMHHACKVACLLRLCWEDSEVGPSIYADPSFASASVDSLAGSSRVAASISTHQLRRVRGPPLLAPSPSPTYTSPIHFKRPAREASLVDLVHLRCVA